MRTKVLSTLRSFANAIPGKIGKPDRLDTATRMAMDADFSDKGDRFSPRRLGRALGPAALRVAMW